MPDQITTEHAYALGYVDGKAWLSAVGKRLSEQAINSNSPEELIDAYNRGVAAGKAEARQRQMAGTIEAKFLPTITVTVTDGKVRGVECDMGDAYQEAHVIAEGAEAELLDGEEPRAKTAIAFVDAHVDTIKQFFISLHKDTNTNETS